MWIAIAIIGLVPVYIIWTYNSFASLRNRSRGAWADIDVQLKRRHDLVPNLVSAVKGYASHEQSVLEEVTRLRSRAMDASGARDRGGAEGEFAEAIKSIFMLSESYPDLRADSNFRDLQRQLTEIEDQIQYARRYYNAVVRDINTKCETFPSGIVGAWFGFARLPYFQAADDEREAAHFHMRGSE